jgi:hypothetical protein
VCQPPAKALIGNSDMNKNLKRAVLLLQIVGGLAGLAVIAKAFLTEQVWPITAIFHIAFIFVFLFGIIAGIVLIKKERLGMLLSAIFQAIQIPIISGPAISYVLFSGASLNLFWHTTGWGFNFLFGSRYYCYFNSGEHWLIGVNFVALIFFILLIREISFASIVAKLVESQPPVDYSAKDFSQTQESSIFDNPVRLLQEET